MKKNHRDGTVARQDTKANFRGPVRDLKNDTVRLRRNGDRDLVRAVRAGSLAPEDASLTLSDARAIRCARTTWF